MVLEVAMLHIVPGQAQDFELAFREAQQIIAAMPGYESDELKKCVEKTDQYLLLVKWDSIESHEQGFRASPDYQRWKQLLHHFYDPFPEVLNYSSVTLD